MVLPGHSVLDGENGQHGFEGIWARVYGVQSEREWRLMVATPIERKWAEEPEMVVVYSSCV